MKKVLLLISILFLIFGIMIARPEDTRDIIDKLDYESVHDPLLDGYNKTYNRTHEYLDDNIDVGGYGIAMVGIILIALSFVKKKEKVAGLLYQNQDRHNISPLHLEKRLNMSTSDSTPSQAQSNPAPITQQDDHLELPELDNPQPATFAPAASIPNPNSQFQHTVHGNPDMTGMGAHESGSSQYECNLCCPTCGQSFSLKGSMKEVICPRCGSRFQTNVM